MTRIAEQICWLLLMILEIGEVIVSQRQNCYFHHLAADKFLIKVIINIIIQIFKSKRWSMFTEPF